MAFSYANAGSALFLSMVVAASLASCGNDISIVESAQGGSSSHSSSSSSSSGSGGGGGVSFATSVGGSDAGNSSVLEVMPIDEQTLIVAGGQTTPTLTYTATLGGKAVNVAWDLDLGNVASISPSSASSAVLAPTGNAGGLVTITAGLNGMTVTRQVLVKIGFTQNGPTAGEMGQVPTSVASLTSGGGIGGVGGEGLGPAVMDMPTLMALGSPTSNGAAQGLAFLYPYNNTVWPRGLLAPLLMWQWTPPGGAVDDADAIQIGLTSADGNFSWTGTFGKPAILAMETPPGTYVRSPIPQDVWAEATNTAGGPANPLTVSLTVAKNGVGYGPITETWVVAPALLDGIIYYQSYGTQLVKNATGAVGGNGSYGGAVLSIHVGDTGPKVVAGTDAECRVCHSVAAGGSRLVVQRGEDYSERSDYELTPSGATEVPLTQEGSWYPAVYPDGSKMLTPDGLLLPLPMDTTPLPVSGLPAAPSMPAFSPDGTLVAFNAGVGLKLTVMSFDATTGAFTNGTTVVTDTAPLLPGWPAFFPDSKSIVFEQEGAPGVDDVAGSSGILWTRGGATGQLAWASIAGGAVTSLDQLNGKGYLPKLAAPSTLVCTADGHQVGAGAPAAANANLDHSDDVDMNYEPTVNPIASGGYAWVVFTSRRMYGNEATIPPFCSDPRGVNLTTNITPKKLWVAAVDLTQAAGTDGSHPAFYLPAQELLAGNSRGFWTLDPCQADGTSCTSGDQCCNGYCEPAGDGGALICSTMPPTSTCSMPGDKCTSTADCCDSVDSCINGFCSQASPG